MNRKATQKTKIEVFLDAEMIAELERIAAEMGTSRSGAARALILKAMAERGKK